MLLWQGVQRIVVFMVNKSKKYRLWSNMALVLKNKRNFRQTKFVKIDFLENKA